MESHDAPQNHPCTPDIGPIVRFAEKRFAKGFCRRSWVARYIFGYGKKVSIDVVIVRRYEPCGDNSLSDKLIGGWLLDQGGWKLFDITPDPYDTGPAAGELVCYAKSEVVKYALYDKDRVLYVQHIDLEGVVCETRLDLEQAKYSGIESSLKKTGRGEEKGRESI